MKKYLFSSFIVFQNNVISIYYYPSRVKNIVAIIAYKVYEWIDDFIPKQKVCMSELNYSINLDTKINYMKDESLDLGVSSYESLIFGFGDAYESNVIQEIFKSYFFQIDNSSYKKLLKQITEYLFTSLDESKREEKLFYIEDETNESFKIALIGTRLIVEKNDIQNFNQLDQFLLNKRNQLSKKLFEKKFDSNDIIKNESSSLYP